MADMHQFASLFDQIAFGIPFRAEHWQLNGRQISVDVKSGRRSYPVEDVLENFEIT